MYFIDEEGREQIINFFDKNEVFPHRRYLEVTPT